MSEKRKSGDSVEETADRLQLGRVTPLHPAAAEVARTTEMISILSREVAQLAQQHDQERGQLDELVKQVSYLKQVLDYSLFVSPDRTCNDSELYPVLLWLRDQFQHLSHSVENQLQAGGLEAIEPALTQQLSRFEERIQPAIESLQVRLIDILRQLASTEEERRAESALLVEELKALSLSGSGERFDALDEQLARCFTFMQIDVLGSLESLKVRMLDVMRMLALIEEAERGQTALLEASTTASLKTDEPQDAFDDEQLLAFFEELRSLQHNVTELRGLFDSFNVRLVDQTRHIASYEAKQEDHFESLKRLLAERPRTTMQGGLRDSLSGESIKGALESINLQLSQQTRQLAVAETQLRSQFGAIRDLVDQSQGGPGRLDELYNGLELINLRLEDSMRFLGKVEEQQRLQIQALRKQQAFLEAQQARLEESTADLGPEVEQKLSRIGAQQHLYYGLIVLLLLGNMAMICWLKISG